MSYDKRYAPGHNKLIAHKAERAGIRVQLATDGSQRCDAGRIEQAEHQEGVGGERRKEACQIRRTAAADCEHGKRTDDNLFSGDTTDERGCCLPAAEAERRKNRRCQLADGGDNAVGGIYHVKADVKVLQEPDDDADEEDNREGLMQKVLGFFPHMHDDVARRRQTVGRQLHDEGNRLAAEYQAVEQKAGDNSNADTGEVERKHDQTAVMREEGGDEHTVDRQLGAAAHERCEHDGHFAVALTGEGARGHDGRHAAAEADDHRNKGRTGEADFTQHLIHNEGNTRHVTAVLEHRKEEEQRNDGRQEGKHGTDAGEDAVDNQRMHRRCDIQHGERVINRSCYSINNIAEDVAEKSSDNVKGEPENKAHDKHENRDSIKFMRQIMVDFDGAQLCFRMLGLLHGLRAEVLDIGIAHICQRRFLIRFEVLLHFGNEVADDIAFVFRKLQCLGEIAVALDKLGGGKAQRQVLATCFGFD